MPDIKKSNIRIFISHIFEEEVIAKAIKKELDECFGQRVEVFLSETIAFGEDWQRNVNVNLTNADLLLVLFSPDSIERPWINIEAGYGIIAGKKVIPIYCLGLDEDRLHYVYQRLKGIDLEKELDVKRLLEDNIAGDLLENNTIGDINRTIESWKASLALAISSYLNQRVIKVKLQNHSYFHIFNEYYNRVLDVLNWSKDSGARIIGFSLHGGNNQLWQLQYVDGNFFRLTPKHSKLCLEVDLKDNGEGAAVLQNYYNGGDNQQWDLTLISSCNYKISPRKYPDFCLSIGQDEKDSQVSTIQLQQWGHKWHQQWCLKALATVTPV